MGKCINCKFSKPYNKDPGYKNLMLCMFNMVGMKGSTVTVNSSCRNFVAKDMSDVYIS